jgi:spore germination protein GerM
MLGMLALIVAIYLFAGLRAFFAGNGGSIGERPTSLPAPTSTQPLVAAATAAPTEPPAPPTPTELPTSTPQPQPTDIPPTDSIIPPPPTSAPTSAPTSPPAPTSAPTTLPTSAPTSAPAAPTSAAPTARPPSPRPTSAPVVAQPRATSPPPVSTSRQPVTLYFADATGTLYVPVRRTVPVENQRRADAAIRALIDGPRNGLQRLVASDARLLGLTIGADGTAFVNFDRPPSDDFGLDSIVLTLTEAEFRGIIQRVQIQVGGSNLGGARARPVVNPINPDDLANSYALTEYLPLYFVSADGAHHVRVIRMVPKTKQTADATMRALLEGPIGYEYALRRSIPEGTELRGVNKDGSVIWVDFTQPFADAPDRDAAVRTVVESLTTLPGVSGVRFLVEGSSLADQWGAEYGRLFTKPPINPE